jgi:hypothetical protein
MSNAKIKLSNYKISFKPLLIILSIAIVITVVMTIIIVGFVSSPFSISIVSKNKVINYQNREIKVVAKKNNNPYKNVSFSIVEDGGDQYNNFLELIIDDQAPAYCTIRLIENENNEPVTSFGTLASDSNYNHATTYFSIQAEFNESNITKSPSVVKKIKYGFYEIYDAFFYNRPIT